MLSLGLLLLDLARLASPAASNASVRPDAAAVHQHEAHPASPGRVHAPSLSAERKRSEIPALSQDEIRSLREGAGHGMAIAAELNHYPGPRHVLDLASDLALTESQSSTVRAIFDRMHARSVPLGKRIIERERALDRAFASGMLDETKLRDLVGQIGTLRGELRATHLKAHLETRALLRPEQIARYDVLRGYVRH